MRVSSGPESGGTPKLAYLPSTNDASNGNVPRATSGGIWRNVLQPDLPGMDPTAFRWSLEGGSKTLYPTTLHSDTPCTRCFAETSEMFLQL